MLCNFQSILIHKGTVDSSLFSFCFFWISYSSAFLPGEPHGQRSLEGYDPLGQKEMTEATQYSCLLWGQLPGIWWECLCSCMRGPCRYVWRYTSTIYNKLRPPANTSHTSEPCWEWILYTLSILQMIVASADNLTAALWEPPSQNHLAKIFLDFWPQKSV